jgi:hypothetical protein
MKLRVASARKATAVPGKRCLHEALRMVPHRTVQGIIAQTKKIFNLFSVKMDEELLCADGEAVVSVGSVKKNDFRARSLGRFSSRSTFILHLCHCLSG